MQPVHSYCHKGDIFIFLANAAEVPDLADKLTAFAVHASYHTFDLFTHLTASNTTVTCLQTICVKMLTRWANVSVACGASSAYDLGCVLAILALVR